MSVATFIIRMFNHQKLAFSSVILMLLIISLMEAFAITLVAPLLSFGFGIKEGGASGSLNLLLNALTISLGFLGIKISLGIILALIVLLFILQSILRFFEVLVETKMIVKQEYAFIHDLYAAYWQAGYPFFLKDKLGKIVNVLTVETDRAIRAFYAACCLLSDLTMVIFYFVLALFISWQMTLVGIAIVIFAAVPIKKIYGYAEGFGKQASEVNNSLQAEVVDKLSAAKLIKASSTEVKAIENLDVFIKLKNKLRVLSQLNAILVPCLYLPVSIILLCLGIYYLVVYLAESFSSVALLALIFFRLNPRFANLQINYQSVVLFIPALNVVDKMMERAREMKEVVGSQRFERLNSGIEFTDVYFSHEGYPPCIKKLNLSIKKGERIALVGGSGAGKTTTVDLLLSLIKPSGGKIYVDGQDLFSYDLFTWRKKIGYLTQEAHLFHGRVRDNLSWVKEQAGDEEIIAAAKLAHAHEFIVKMPQGYDTVIGDRGLTISGGQRQRLALARSILQDPEIIIFDEALSSLDSESELKIMQAIDALPENKTIIFVSHRLSTVKNVDRIYLFGEGTVLEVGTWEKLVKEKGLFEQLIKMQIL